MSTVERETWATRIGFILAAVGSAVGLGNLWRFPFQAGQEGGSAFLVVYLAFVVLIGLPAILVEFVIGRRAEQNPITAFDRLGYRAWTFVGVVAVTGGIIIMSFYAVVAGWIARYLVGSVTGAYFDDSAAYFESVAAGPDALALHFLFLAVTAAVVYFGVQRGIELAVKFMVPALLALMVVLVGYAATLEGASEGYAYYLSPEPGVIAANWQSILPAAMGQALFTLSLGMGIMITYASYVADDRSLAIDGGWIAAIDTLVAILAGLMIFPVVFTVGAAPEETGPAALFVGVGDAIASLPAGEVIGVLFFGTVLLAALSSAISLFEVPVSFLIDATDLERPGATAAVASVIFVLGIPTALDTAVLEIYDAVTAQLFLPLTTLLLVLFVGWFYDEALDEVSRGMERDWLPNAWLWHVRTLLLVVIGLTLVVSVTELAGTLPEALGDVQLV